MFGSRSARRWPTRASAVPTLSWAIAAFTPWLRPSVIACSSVMGPVGAIGCCAPRCWAATGVAASSGVSARSARRSDERVMTLTSMTVRGMGEHPVEVQVNQSFDRLLFGERLRIEAVEEALHLRGMHQHRAEPPRAKPVRAPAKLPAGHAALQDLLDQAPGTQDHFIKVEPGQFGEVWQLTLHHPGQLYHRLAPQAAVHAPDQLRQQLAGGAVERTHEDFRLGERGNDLGAHHLAEQGFLGIEVAVDRALADPGEAGDVFDLGAGEASLAEDGKGGLEDLIGPRVRAALPAWGGGGSEVGLGHGHSHRIIN